MKLISRFRDYYDYNIGLYGIDEKVVYNRLPFPDKYYHNVDMSEIKSPLPRFYQYYTNSDYEYVHLLFCGKLYYVKRLRYQLKPELEIVTEADLSDYLTDRSRYMFFRKEVPKYGTVYESLMEVHRITKQPVLLLDGFDRNQFRFSTNIPILKDIKGFGALVDSRECYLEIIQCIIDINNTESIPVSTDTDKIVSHGFDKKISFRHRK